MPQSIREQILQTLMATLAPVAAAQSATLLRSPVPGVPREASPALLLFPESDTLLGGRHRLRRDSAPESRQLRAAA